MMYSGEEIWARILINIGEDGEVKKPEWIEPMEKVRQIEDLDSYISTIAWAIEGDREVALMALTEAAVMQAVCSDEAGLRRVFVSLLSNARSEFGMFYAGGMTLVRRYLYSCIYKLHGYPVAKAYGRNSLHDILAFWPDFDKTYHFLMSVGKVGPELHGESPLARGQDREGD